MDIVYILKEDENNIDLVYSLRSLKYVSGFDRIWMVGYKPSWITDDIECIPTIQNGNKWENSFNNMYTACKDDRLSKDIVLFNDDFFAIKNVDLEVDLNYYRNSLDEAIEMYSNKVKTRWIRSHQQTKELLISLNSSHYMNFALHIPMIFNRKRFIEIVDNKIVRNHLHKYRILSYRSLYGNLDWKDPERIEDCKGKKGEDIKKEVAEGKWISVFDGMTGNLANYPRLNTILSEFKSEKSRFEKYSILCN